MDNSNRIRGLVESHELELCEHCGCEDRIHDDNTRENFLNILQDKKRFFCHGRQSEAHEKYKLEELQRFRAEDAKKMYAAIASVIMIIVGIIVLVI